MTELLEKVQQRTHSLDPGLEDWIWRKGLYKIDI